MKRNLLIPLILLISFLPFLVAAQNRVVHFSQIPNFESINVIPDVEGMVLMSDEQFFPVQNPCFKDAVEVMEGWPVGANGSTNRGGIYCNLDDDPELEIMYNIDNKVFAWNADGTDVTGWPKSVSSSPSSGAPAYGDIDGDGVEEVVVSCQAPGTGNTGKIYAFGRDGSIVSGFPVSCAGGPTRTPVLADLEDDGAMEIIVELRNYPNGNVCVYHGDGTIKEGWPVAMDYIPASSVAVGDITGDGIPEIIAESYYKVWAFGINGDTIAGFPYTPGADRVFSYSSPVIANMDGIGPNEILVGDHNLSSGNGAVHVIKNDGTAYPGWPKFVSHWIYGPIAVADIDGNGIMDVTVGDQVLSGSAMDYVYGWDKDGMALTGFPIGPVWAVNSQIILADLDGDNMLELMFDDNTGNGIYNGFNHDGTMMEGWPITVSGTSFFINPFVTDIDGDGMLNLNGGGYDSDADKSYIYLWTNGVGYNEQKAVLPVLQYNVRHTGVYGEKGNPTVSVNDKPDLHRFQLNCYPNPCNDKIRLAFILSQTENILLSVFDGKGMLIKRTDLGTMQAGNGNFLLNITGFDNGIYFIQLNGSLKTNLKQKILVLK